jgi:16S rRNA (cytosine967-C5)-methyltransferase
VSGQKPREIAVRVLKQRLNRHEYVEKLLEQELAQARLLPQDRALCQELVYGIVRWQKPLDWLIAGKTQGRTQNITLQSLLQLGLYQLFWLERIPNHAAVHETVELAKFLGFGPQAGFVNAVLRGYVREMDQTKGLLRELKKTEPALGYSHPEWLVERWLARYGAEKMAQLLEWNNAPAGTFARLNTLKANAEILVRDWEQEEVTFNIRRWDWTGENVVFELQSHRSLATLRTFQQGFFYIQDPSTLLAVRELNPQPGESILDFCAAPGGKTTYIAQLMENRGRIVAQDSQADRLGLIQENCQRLGVTCVETAVAPLANDPNLPGKFDRILVDAPCSNTGVLRRRIDLRWRIRLDEIERLRLAQFEILNRAALRLKPGGTLIYSTCSLEPEENSELVQHYLKERPGFKLERERQLLPFVDGVDGAYVATLKGT